MTLGYVWFAFWLFPERHPGPHPTPSGAVMEWASGWGRLCCMCLVKNNSQTLVVVLCAASEVLVGPTSELACG